MIWSRNALLVMIMALSLGVPSVVLGLNSPSAAQAPECVATGGAIVAAMSTNPPTLDPMLSTTTASRQVALYIFESLMTFDETYSVIPQLAEGWTIDSNGLVYTFRLRSGVRFHNGQMLTAADVKASFERYLKAAPGASGRFAAVQSVAVVDNLTLRFQLTSRFPFLANLAMPSPLFGVMPKAIVDKYGEKEIREQDLIGTGPYKFGEWRPDVAVRLAKFADYRPDTRFPGPTGFGGRRIACADHVGLIPVAEAGSRVAGVLTGTYDFAESVPITSVPQLEAHRDINVEIVKPKWGILVELNPGEPPMNKLAFRKALVASLNMSQILAATSFGNRPEYIRPSPSIFFPEQKDWYSTAGSGMYNKPDLDLARRLLAEADYKNEPIIYLTNQNFDWMYKASLATASQWQRAGINIKVEMMDWPSQIQRARSLKGWHINQTGWSPRFDPSQTITSLRCDSVSAYNYCNREMDRLLDQVNSDLPLKERQAVWNAIQKLVWDDVAIIRIGDYFEPEAIRTSLKGYRPFHVIPRFWNVSKVR